MRLILSLALALCACSSPQVRCDKHLLPINAPAAKELGAKEPVASDPAAPTGSRL
jgi:uncharacterized lipoprotein YmbA